MMAPTVLVVSTRGAVGRARATVRSLQAAGEADCVVIDVDGAYRPLADERVERLEQLAGDVLDGRRAALLGHALDPAEFELLAGVAAATAIAGGRVLVAAGTLVLGPLGPLAEQAPADGLALVTRTNARRLLESGRTGWFGTLGREPDGSLLLPQGSGGWSSFARALVAIGPDTDLDLLHRAAADPRTAPLALELAADQLPTTVVRAPEVLVSAWRGSDSADIGRDEAGVLRLDGTPVTALDLSGLDPRKPWLIDAAAPFMPLVTLSAHSDLAALVAEEATRRAADAPEETGDESGDEVHEDLLLRWCVRQAIAADTPVPDLRERQALVDWVCELVPEGHRHPVARYLAAAREVRPDLERAFPAVPGPGSRRLARWAVLHGVNEGIADPELLRLASEATLAKKKAPKATAGPRPRGVNVVGYLAGELGLGESARLMEASLRAAGERTSTIDVSATITSRRRASYHRGEETLFDTSLIHVNGAETGYVVGQVREVVTGTFRIGMWYWEMEDMAPRDRDGFEHVDEVWAATDFIRDAFAVDAPVPVRTVMPPLPQRSEVVPPFPDRLGLPRDRPWFLFAFDYLSVSVRKNPWGLVEAFERAFPVPEPDGPLLVLKAINSEKFPDLAEHLRLTAAARPDIRLVEDYLPAEERDALMAHCTAYVSLHKAEGLGLTIAEAMSWGKPVIATGYGGNMQFMTPENSIAVGWTYGELPETYGPFRQGFKWAEPDLDEAAAALRLVVDEPERAAALGARAARDIAEKHSVEAAARGIKEALETGRAEWEARKAAEEPSAGRTGPRRSLARRVASRVRRAL